MALDNLDKVPVTGKYRELDGDPAQGTITFQASTILVDPATSEIVLPVPHVVTLVDGDIPEGFELPATNDPDLVPQGWFYIVTEQIIGVAAVRPPYVLEVPHDSTGIDLSAYAATDPPAAPELYLSLAAWQSWLVNEYEPGGGGGGGVTSVNGQTGVVTLTAANVGAAPASHTHPQSDVTGLTAALAGKADASHTHVIGDVTGLQAALDGKAAANHTHAAADITTGVLDLARIPTLDAGRVPNLATSKITSGTFAVNRGGTGVATVAAGSYLRGNGTSAMVARTAAEVRSDIEAPRIVNTDGAVGRTIHVGAAAPSSPAVGDVRIRPSGA